MVDRLTMIFDLQRKLQEEKMGGHPRDFEPERAIQFIKDMTLALTDELHEALDEVGWKPWATSRHIKVDAYKDELVDAMHFFVNLCLVVGMGPAELHDRYVKKNQKNAKRQDEGYDGVSTKCPGCHRALDDAATKCQVSSEELLGDDRVVKAVWCDE